jgi:hypothetical protein
LKITSQLKPKWQSVPIDSVINNAFSLYNPDGKIKFIKLEDSKFKEFYKKLKFVLFNYLDSKIENLNKTLSKS